MIYFAALCSLLAVVATLLSLGWMLGGFLLGSPGSVGAGELVAYLLLFWLLWVFGYRPFFRRWIAEFRSRRGR